MTAPRGFATRAQVALLLVVFLALAAGAFDLAGLAAKKWIIGRWIGVSPQVVWLAPISYVLVFAVVAVLWLVAGGLVPVLGSAGLLAFGLAVLGTAGTTFIFHPQIHKAAGLLLSFGVGVRLFSFARHRPDALLRFSQRAIPGLAVVFLLLGVGVNVRGWLNGRRAERALPAAPAGAPNILLLIMDTARSLSMSAFGYDRPTSPAVERLAARGVRFDRAFAPAPWTNPSHASFFTGRPAHELAADWWVPMDDRDSTLAEVLRVRGWRSAAFVGNTAMAHGESGLGRGFEPYDYHHFSLEGILNASSLVRFLGDSRPLRRLVADWRLLGRRSGERVNAEFLAWLGDPRDRPFFVFLNNFDAHTPYTPPEPFRSRFAGDVRVPGLLTRIRNRGEPMKQADFHPADSADIRQLYDASVAYADDGVGRLLHALDNLGVLANTIVVLVSDHGEEFYEHRAWEHSQTVYHAALRVPLIVSWPGHVPEGRVVTEPVETRRIAATILDLVGAGTPLPGSSLAASWDGGAAGDTAVSSRTPLASRARPGDAPREWSLVAGDYHYIMRLDRRAELYDYVRDPYEQRDLAGDPAMREVLEAFARRLAAVSR